MISEGLTKQQKAKLRMRLNKIFDPFRIHGLDVFVPPAIEAVIKEVERTLGEKDHAE